LNASLQPQTGAGSVCKIRDELPTFCALDDASRPEDMNLPGFRFHGLGGRNKGRFAVDASGNWRITFGWADGDAVDVDLEDYH
jgi:plasmid maintenance system killer protein